MTRPPFLDFGRSASPMVSTDSYEVIDTGRHPVSDTDLDQLSSWPTTRSFPRSTHGNLAAWRDSVDYANPIEHEKAPSRLFDRLWWIGTVVLLVLLGLRVDDLLVAVMHK